MRFTKGQMIPLKEWVILYSDPSFLFGIFEPPGERQRMKLLRGVVQAEILDEEPTFITTNGNDGEHKVSLWKIRVYSLREQFDSWEEAVGEGDDVHDLEGWVGTHSFRLTHGMPSKLPGDDNG